MFQYRIYPTSSQEKKLNETVNECRWLYNHLLEKRKTAYEQEGKGLSCYQQQGTYPMLKQERPSLSTVHSQVLQNVAVRVEDLHVNRMVHNHCLAKSIQDAAWSAFFAQLSYKAEEAGRHFIKVNPAYTSQDCSRCHHRQSLPLSERVYQCPCCLLCIDRDLNAAKNVVALGRQGCVVPEASGAGAVRSRHIHYHHP